MSVHEPSKIETLGAAWNLSELGILSGSQVQPASRNEKIKTAVKEAADRCWTQHNAMLLLVEPSFHNLTIVSPGALSCRHDMIEEIGKIPSCGCADFEKKYASR